MQQVRRRCKRVSISLVATFLYAKPHVPEVRIAVGWYIYPRLNPHWEKSNLVTPPNPIPHNSPIPGQGKEILGNTTLAVYKTTSGKNMLLTLKKEEQKREPKEVRLIKQWKINLKIVNRIQPVVFPDIPEVRASHCWNQEKCEGQSFQLHILHGFLSESRESAVGPWIIYTCAWQETSNNLYIPSGCNLKH